MRDADARRAIEAAARTLVVERYDWSAVASDFESALLKAAGLHMAPRKSNPLPRERQ